MNAPRYLGGGVYGMSAFSSYLRSNDEEGGVCI